MKPKIAVDIDGVLAENDGPLCDKINAELGADFKPSDFTTYYALDELVKPYFASDQEAHDYIAGIWWTDGYLASLPIYLSAIPGMRLIAGLAREVTILTARNVIDNPTAKIQTKCWLDRYGLYYDKLVFETDKALYCRSNGINYIIEDAPHTALSCAGMGIGVFLIDKPYNREVEATGLNGIWRITHLTEVPPLILEDLAR